MNFVPLVNFQPSPQPLSAKVPEDVPAIEIDISEALLQEQSPLFSTLPPEIRNHIFWLALQEYDDPSKLYPRNTYYTRPGWMGVRRVDTELLRTCKRVYSETKSIPLHDVEIAYHLGDRMRTSHEFTSLAEGRWYRLKKHPHLHSRKDAMRRPARFTAQLFALREENIHGALWATNQHETDHKPELVTICIRYTDWRWWEHGAMLNLPTDGWKDIKFPRSVRKVVMELETRDTERKKMQLDSVVEHLFNQPSQCLFGREDGKYLRISEQAGVRTWRWDGPTVFGDGATFSHHPKTETMPYVVEVVTWEVVEGDE